jgi:thiopeptide-type bacteriocin biosynthesis protein
VAAYRMLFAIENEGSPPYLEWSWAPLVSPFLPRVTLGRAVLALAEWHVGAADIATLDAATPARRLLAVRRLRERLRIPRIVSIVDVERPTFDNVLYVDLDHSLQVDAFVYGALVSGRAVVRETFADRDELVVRSTEGGFSNEVVIPFVTAPLQGDRTAAPGEMTPPSPRRGRHAFPPGAEWITLRIDAGMGHFDRLLLDHFVPEVRRALAAGEADAWFFLRLGLPTPQLRLRLHGDPERLRAPRGRLESLVGKLVEQGRVFRAEWTTYEREVERYGGDEGVVISERIFECDSDAVVATLAALSDPADELARERLAAVGVDRLLDDLGLTMEVKLDVLDALCTRWRTELAVDPAVDIRLGALFRDERELLERMLAGDAEEVASFDPIWRVRSSRIQPHAAELHELRRRGRLALDISALAPSFVHMHCIRSMVRHSRIHELVIYDFLRRSYRTRVAKARARRQPPTS